MDEYQWLEDENSKKTKAWIQNKTHSRIVILEEFLLEKNRKRT